MNSKNMRKRPSPLDEVEDDGKDGTAKRPAKSDNRLYFSTGTSEHIDSKNVLFQYESSEEIQVQNNSKATATLETETDFSRDARAIRERTLKKAEEALKGKNKTSGDVKVYKGINSYQPDICKDYGDSCKFMHERGDYRFGWEMDIEWDEKRNLALRGHDEDNVEYEEEDSLPFACFICRRPFLNPVMTKCKHYFCEFCALKHHARHKKCFVCDQPTLGIFNTVHEMPKRMAAEKK